MPGAVRRRFERAVGAEIRPGEGRTVALLFTNLFLLLTAYYVLKVIREPLLLVSGGAVLRQYARGVEALVLLALVPAYGLLADRVEPSRLVAWVTGFFTACLAAFWLLARAGVPVGFAFFVWLGIFSTLAIAQFWSLANDLHGEDEGRRLFPLVAFGGTLGAIAGAQIAARLVAPLGAANLMLAAGALLLACIALTGRVRARIAARGPAAPLGAGATHGGFRLMLADPYLRLIALGVLALNLVNTTGDFVLARFVEGAAAASHSAPADREAWVGAFYGDFQTAVTVLTALFQFFFVARVFRRIGIAGAVRVLPIVVLVGYCALSIVPVLVVAQVVKIIENSAEYSLQSTTQQALFLRTSREAKYKAKAAIDTFVVRFGDLGSTLLVAAGIHLGLGARGFTLVNIAVAAGWLVVAVALGRAWRRRAPEGRPRARHAATGPPPAPTPA